MRQTGYGLKELLGMRKRGEKCDGCGKGFILNEIGCIMLKDGPEARDAETFLLGLLDTGELFEKAIAFGYLSNCDRIAEKTAEKVTVFKNDPKNREVLKETEIARNRSIRRQITALYS